MMIICEQYLYLIKKIYIIGILPMLATPIKLRTKLQQITFTIYLIKIYLIIFTKRILNICLFFNIKNQFQIKNKDFFN